MTSPAAASNPPAVLTAAQRHELARQFERAKQLAAKCPPDYRGVHRVLSDCCTLDPGNTLFVAALLENLQRARGRTRSQWFWMLGKLRGELARSIARADWNRALQAGWELLGEAPRDAEVLRHLALICESLDHGPTQIVLLRSAQQFAPSNIHILRPLALELSAAGQFQEAAAIWQTLLRKVPGDDQSQEFIRILIPRKKPVEPNDGSLAERVSGLLQAQDWNAAEQLLATEAGSAGADLELRQLGEELSLGRAQERTEIARQLAKIRLTPVMQRLVDEMTQEQRRIELGVAYSRYERYPTEPVSSWNMAECLTAVGNYSEALKYLQPLLHGPKPPIAALVKIAENWQHLRQFDRALAAYREAMDHTEFDPEESSLQQAALYHGAVLAEAMGQPALALGWLERLVTVSRYYKDASARLDKLQVICNKGGFSAGPEVSPSG